MWTRLDGSRSLSRRMGAEASGSEPGALVAEVAREHGVNANQVFKCGGHLSGMKLT
jgi:hypothetical protein